MSACPRDSFGFCRISLLAPSLCGAASEREGGAVRCPDTREEAKRRLRAARDARIAAISDQLEQACARPGGVAA